MEMKVASLHVQQHNEDGQPKTGTAEIEVQTRDMLLMLMKHRAENVDPADPLSAVIKQFMENACNILATYVKTIEFTDRRGKYKCEFFVPEGETSDQVQKKVKSVLENTFIKPIIKQFIFLLPEDKRYHKQSRSLSLTIARDIGRERNQPSLFSLQMEDMKELKIAHDQGEKYTRDLISKNVAILCMKLFQLWQTKEKNKEEFIELSNDGEIAMLADEMGVSISEMKKYFFILSTFNFPIIYKDNAAGEIGLTSEKLCEVHLKFDLKYQNLNFKELLNKPLKRITVKPSQRFIEDLSGEKGSGLGYVKLLDNIFRVALDLSDYAVKILNFSITQKPTYKISADKLIAKLNLTSQAKKQGMPRIHKMLEGAFNELLDKGHFSSFTLPQGNDDMYSWTYTDKYVMLQSKRSEEKGDWNDELQPIEKRRDWYINWLIRDKKETPAKARNQAFKRFPEK